MPRGRCLAASAFAWPDHAKGIEEAYTPPKSWYTDSDFLAKVEKTRTFNGWTYAGRVDQVREPNSYIARTLMGDPYVIVNQQDPEKGSAVDGVQLKAFYNVCRHHAAQILDDGEGSLASTKGRMVCPYHGWEYTRDGRLAKAVKMTGCKNFRTRDLGLVPISVDTLGPWIFVNRDPNSAGSLLADQPDMKEFWQMLLDSGVNELQHVGHRRYHLKCNWKVFIDNYLDGGYHVSIAHPKLAANLNMDGYRNAASENYFLQRVASLDEPGATGRFKQQQDSIYLWHYPNLCVNRYGDWMDTNVCWPVGVDECIVDFDWFTTPEIAADKAQVRAALEDSDLVQQEDVELCARVQAGLGSNGFRVGRYAPQLEGGEYLFHQRLHADMTIALGPGP